MNKTVRRALGRRSPGVKGFAQTGKMFRRPKTSTLPSVAKREQEKQQRRTTEK